MNRLGIESLQEAFGELGFVARRLLPLTAHTTVDLLDKVTGRLGLAGAEKDALIRETKRPEYLALAQVPFTLTLLAKVLASKAKGVSEIALSRTAVYDSSLVLLLGQDLQKAGRDAGMEASMRSMLCSMSFWNHLSGTVTQPWSSFFFLGAGVAVVQATNLSALASGDVRFTHLSFQEFLSAEFLALLKNAFSELGDWLRACSGDPWWSQVLLMTSEILPPAQRSAFLDALADNRCEEGEPHAERKENKTISLE